jgi:CheY-like chemotaxis protein
VKGEARTDEAPVATLQILVAEDNRVNQKVARRLLEKQGHQVAVVATGREAVEACRATSFDLVLMDIDMPELNGYEATAAIRSHEATIDQYTPILALTANAMKGDREKCLAAGMDGYVAKPIQLDELREAIAQVSSAPDQPAYEVQPAS